MVNHREPMVPQVRALGIEHVDHIAIFDDIRHWETTVKLIRPRGGIVSICDTGLLMPMAGMKRKAASLHWAVYVRAGGHSTPDMIEQRKLLTYVAGETDTGRIRIGTRDVLPPINAEKMRKANALVEAGQVKGKIMIACFAP